MDKKILIRQCLVFLFLLLPIIGNCSEKHEDHEGDHHEESSSVTISPDAMIQNEIKVATVQPAKIATELEVIGKIVPNRDHIAPIYPRFSGIVKTLTKRLGDTVTANEVLARIESNESLQAYEVKAPFSGVVIQKHVNVGMLVKEDRPLYEIADLSTVWVDLSVYRKEASKIKQDQPVIIKSEGAEHNQVQSKINYVSPIGVEDSQTLLARVFLPNANNEWLPGMYVDALITVSEKSVAMAVTRNALQKIESQFVVFVQQGKTFVASPVKIGTQDSTFVEILEGLKPGQTYASENSFILKADLGKGAAEHEH